MELKRTFEADFDTVMAALSPALAEQGFGTLTTIDLAATLKQKIGVDFRRYVILGACNPTLAHQALEADLDIGLFMPCNVIVYEPDGGGTVVSIFDPMELVARVPRLKTLAQQGREKLARALEELSC